MLCSFDMNHRDPYSLLLSSPFSSNFPPSKGPLFTSHVHQTLVNFHVICHFCHIPLVITFFHVDYENLSNSPLFFVVLCSLGWPGKLFYYLRLRHRAFESITRLSTFRDLSQVLHLAPSYL